MNRPAFSSIKDEVMALKGKPVVYAERRGSKQIKHRGILAGVYDSVGVITLDEELYNYDSFSFSYAYLLTGEGTLKLWDKEIDSDIILKNL